VLAFAALLLAAQPSGPAIEWWYITSSNELGPIDVFYADRASRRRTGDRVLIDEARESDSVDENGTTGARLRVEYDCRAHTLRFLAIAFLGADGEVMSRGVNENEAMRAIPPDSTANSLMAFACGEGEGREALGALQPRDHAARTFPALRNRPKSR
jgi:hypothetical protein